MTLHRLLVAIWLAGFFALGAVSNVQAMRAPTVGDGAITIDDVPSGLMQFAQAQPTQTPAAPATPAPSPAPSPSSDANAPADQQAAGDEPIGNVASLTGVATVIRNRDSIALKLKDDIYLNDTVQTAASSSLGITFNDATTFHLSANAKITIDNYVYEEGGGNNNGVFDIAKGTVAFVAAQVAKTGNMQITTPTATLGIRGTTGLVEVPEDGGAAAANANNVNIKLYPDADGHVGRIEVNDRQGARLGALTSGASGFAIRPGTAGARFAAVPLAISPRQQTRDQGFVRQVHATQTVGRQIVTEQRAFRRANPGLNNRNNPARQPGQQPGQPGQQPGQNRPGQPGQQPPGQNRPGQPQQPGTPNNRQGQRPGQPGQPGQPARPGQPGQPGQPAQPGQRGGQTTPPANPAQPGTPSRAGQNTPAGQAQPGTPTRPGQTAQPARPEQPGAPAQPRGGQPTGQPTPPPLPNGQPLLRQPGPPRPVPGVQRPGIQNRPAATRPKAPPPKDKKKK